MPGKNPNPGEKTLVELLQSLDSVTTYQESLEKQPDGSGKTKRLVVISDASPLIALATVNHLDLLPGMFSEVWIPPRVATEIAKTVPPAAWLLIRQVQSVTPPSQLRRLDAGEAEALLLALELQADLVVMDERDGRQMARRLGLLVTGTLGIAAVAKLRGFIPAARPLIERLVQAGLHVTPEVVADALRLAGEA